MNLVSTIPPDPFLLASCSRHRSVATHVARAMDAQASSRLCSSETT